MWGGGGVAMATVAWWELQGEVIDAATAAGCTAAEAEHALRLLATWHSTERAVAYCKQCEAAHQVAAAQARCPYVGEF